MIRTHGRYDYSNITKRPDYTWPGGKRLAVYVAVNIEQFSYGEGKGAAIAPNWPAGVRAPPWTPMLIEPMVT